MTSYFDNIDICVRRVLSTDELVAFERDVIDNVHLVTGDREFPSELREEILDIIAVDAVEPLAGFVRVGVNNPRAFWEATKSSRLIANLHSAFHRVAASRIETRFGILSDNPLINLAMRDTWEQQTYAYCGWD